MKAQFFEFVKRYQNYPGEVEHRESAPWQEVVIEEDINLFDILPLFRLNHGDGGFYIDKASVVSRDPSLEDNEASQNVGIYRIEVKGKIILACNLSRRTTSLFSCSARKN